MQELQNSIIKKSVIHIPGKSSDQQMSKPKNYLHDFV